MFDRSAHEDMWKTIPIESGKILVDEHRRGWRTVRLFLSATVSDFQDERQKLATQIIPQLRMWCENRKIQLIEVDLQWSKESRISETGSSLEMSMRELQRCREENMRPFFLSLLSEMYGWVPPSKFLTKELRDRYGWVPGFSQNAMEIIYGSYIDRNPNALIFIRDPTCISRLACQDDFVDKNHKEDLTMLKEKIRQRFPSNQVMDYTLDIDDDTLSERKLQGIAEFCSSILTFFKQRISEQYPDPESAIVNAQSIMFTERRLHTQFIDIRSSAVYGRGKLKRKVMSYIGSAENNVMTLYKHCYKRNATKISTVVLSMPVIQKKISMFLATKQHEIFIMHGDAGAGKSSLLASCCHLSSQLFPGLRFFYHFVGAGGGSTDLVRLLRRLFMELAPDIPIPNTEEELVRATPQMLKRSGQEGGLVIFIDALNQLDIDAIESNLAWLPIPLPVGVRCVFSMITGTTVHKMITVRAPATISVEVGALDYDACAEIVNGYLGLRNRSISSAHEKSLLAKRGAKNPLWLVTACEELRIHRSIAATDDKIASFSDSLLGLLQQVLKRIEEEHGKDLVMAALCFLECSRHGLLETELLVLLAEPRNYIFTESETYEPTSVVPKVAEATSNNVEELQKQLHNDAKFAVQDELKNTSPSTASKLDTSMTSDREQEVNLNNIIQKQLLTASWSPLYQSLQPFLRPCGEPGEGRLDFFHRAVSKAVRLRYLTRKRGFEENNGKATGLSHLFSGHDGSTEKDEDRYIFWHGKLADHFEACRDYQRKAEELPYHLEKILSISRLLQMLANWDTFNAIYAPTLYHEDNKGLYEILYYGRKAGGFNVVAEMLEAQIQMWEVSGEIPKEDIAHRAMVIGKFLQKAGKEVHATSLLSERISDKSIANTVVWADMCVILARAIVTTECGKASGRRASAFRRSQQLQEGALSVYQAQIPLPWRAICNSVIQVIQCELEVDYDVSTQFIARIEQKIKEVKNLALQHNAKDILADVHSTIATLASVQKRSYYRFDDEYMYFFQLVNENQMLGQKYMEQSCTHTTNMSYSSIFFNLGMNYHSVNDITRAEAYYRQSVITAESISSSDHPWSKYHRQILSALLSRLDGRGMEATEIENGGIVHPPNAEHLAD